ncbi:MAG: TIGR02186 family protein [Paracoccaceae bacterium]
MMRWLALCLLMLPAVAQGESIVAGLSQNSVAITTNFDGSEILIYGAVKRDAPAPDDKPLEVIITVEGPSLPMTIRRKERRTGIWMNVDAVTVDSAPTFYAVATTGPLSVVLKDTDNLRHRITIPRVIRAVGITDEAANAQDFVLAYLRLREEEGTYRVDQGAVELLEETLFRTDVVLPANLTDGEYRVRIFITRDGRVIDHQERVIGVRKAGIERVLFNLAQDQPLVSGVLSVLMAVVAGWAASAAFRLIRA